MPVIKDALFEKAKALQVEAIDLMGAVECSAEDFEKAEKMINDAENMVKRSKRIDELKKAAIGEGDNKAIEDNKPHETEDKTRDKKENKSPWNKKFGNFLVAVHNASKGLSHPNLQQFISEVPQNERKELAEAVGATGGFLVPTEFQAKLLAAIEEVSIVRKRAFIIPMTRRQIEVPALKQDGSTAGTPNWFGGMNAFWQEEADTITETTPNFRNIIMTAHELTAVTHASNNLLADSAISLSALLMGPHGFPGVVAWKEDYAFLRGSGSGQPLGVINAGATISVTRDTALSVIYVDLLSMMTALLPSANAVWVAHIALKAELMTLTGPAGQPAYLWGDATKGIPNMLLGMPIEFTEKATTLGTKGDIGLYDFSHYYIGDRKNTTIESTDQERWLRNQTSWKVTHRVDGQPWLNAPFTLVDGSTTISPFVVLTTKLT